MQHRQFVCPSLQHHAYFQHDIFATNLLTNSLTKSTLKQMSHIFVMFGSQKFVANQIGLPQITQQGNFESEFVIKFVAKT
jgi:hypothetical protein